MGVRLTLAAERDVIEVWRYGAREFGVARADAFHERLERTFELLAANPRLARERTEIVPPVRVHPVGPWLIVYVVEEGDEVLIVRLRHGREDWVEGAA